MTQAFNLSQFANKVNTSGQASLTTAVSGTLPVANGGTGDTTYTNGQLLIGNTTGNTLTKATLTAGTGISVTNGSGSITIASTASGGFSNLVILTSTNASYSIPATTIKVTVVGGGGTGGSNASGYGTAAGGGGGGGGGSAIKVLSSLTIGNTLNITVGGSGGTSSVASGTQTITTVSATGGSTGTHGSGNIGGDGGSGGLGSGGTLNIQGGGGGFGQTSASRAGAGGSSILGGGAASTGAAGGSYGGGGSNNNAGASGVVVIEY